MRICRRRKRTRKTKRTRKKRRTRSMLLFPVETHQVKTLRSVLHSSITLFSLRIHAGWFEHALLCYAHACVAIWHTNAHILRALESDIYLYTRITNNMLLHNAAPTACRTIRILYSCSSTASAELFPKVPAQTAAKQRQHGWNKKRHQVRLRQATPL